MSNIKLKQVKIKFAYTSGQRFIAKGNISGFKYSADTFFYTIKSFEDGHKVSTTHEIPLIDVKSIIVKGPDGYAKAQLKGYREMELVIQNGKIKETIGRNHINL